ncbi:MAG: LON peptidase substrate-binding domain-containing protein, partial [Bryobacteraceae bacterium]
MEASLVPLFPLPVVAFPRTNLPLHIFEERYKEMVGEAIERRSEFGIVLARDEGVARAGCTVVVSRVLQRYEDGRLDIVTRGVRRFEILSLDATNPCLRGEVRFFDDDDPGPAPAPVRERAIESFRRWAALGEPRPFGEADLDDPQLSFQLAQAVRDVEFLQALLENKSEPQRLKQVGDFLSRYAAKQRRVE